MRLLKYNSDSEPILVEYSNDENVPPYAILSHTWQEGQEVTFGELMSGNGKDKAGYSKILFCIQQTQRDGLDYCWVDTCCIDKSSSAELTEAINSMFRWYQKAQRCYVYLSDVPGVNTAGNVSHVQELDSQKDDGISQSWESEFRRSRWFTRGWTLQELIAPESVEFFNQESKWLGDKKSLELVIHSVTGIPIEALRGSPLRDFSEQDRFSWAATRQTTRQEDWVYSLLGIFDIQMPLLYGEGSEKAMRRLRKEIREAVMDLPSVLTHNLHSRDRHTDDELERIRRWLSAPDPSSNYQRALKQRQESTGLWFLENDQYVEWKTTAASFVWLHGIPGCGKTVLLSTVLENVLNYCGNDTEYVVVYFFFDFKDVQKQNTKLMVQSLIWQLLQRCTETPTSITTFFSSFEIGKQELPLGALLEVLHKIIQEFPRIYIVLDALDECSDRVELLGVLDDISTWQLKNLHILLTSRRERDIEAVLNTFVDQQNIVCLQSELVDKDIERYVQQRLLDDTQLVKWAKDVTLRHEIELTIMRGAQGMFRWAVCQLDALQNCRTRAALRRTLATLPLTLDKTYDRILSSISEDDAPYAVSILRWLAFSRRPLSLGEVSEIVAITLEDEARFDRDEILEDPFDVLNICSSLVTLYPTNTSGEHETMDPTRQVVTLAHYSVKEYLLSERITKGSATRYSMQETACHDLIARSCVVYLLQFRTADILSQDDSTEFKLADYSAQFWKIHAWATRQETEGYVQEVLDLISESESIYANSVRVYDPYGPRAHGVFREMITMPLHFASKEGLTKIVEKLIEKGADVNSQAEHFDDSTAIQLAALLGHEDIVKLLLKNGANVNAKGGTLGNALQAAVFGNEPTLVELLIQAEAEVSNALVTAVYEDNEEMTKLLLKYGADANFQGGCFGNVLWTAIVNSSVHLVRLLLDHGADPAFKDKHGWTTSMVAFETGSKEIRDIFGVHDYDSLSGRDRCLVPSSLTVPKDSEVDITGNSYAISKDGNVLLPVVQMVSDHPFSINQRVMYFEATIHALGTGNAFGIGISDRDLYKTHMVGWGRGTYGYHSDTGDLYCESGEGTRFGATFGVGDVVGCGSDKDKDEFFFTKNGERVGSISEGRSLHGRRFAVVSLMRGTFHFSVNFGPGGFAYPL
ncbi:unnamed protein product [Periconia digitata]|uniref:Protein SSH4 n=1 Tax=Periconia digitata TaxID=1303443 RepID=A0A9W4UQX7_9PLEO|nr:unnamed protein product [Periconia digitata]